MRPAIAIALGVLNGGVAFAADTVVYTGDAAEARARVTAATSRPETDFDFVALQDALKGDPITLTAGKLEVCAGPPAKVTDVAALLATAETAVADLDFGTALTSLQTADQQTLCLTEPLDPAATARIQYLRGVALHFEGQSDAARLAFLQALELQPEMQWDMSFPPSAMVGFDGARNEITNAGTVQLAIIPRYAPVEADGKTATRDQARISVTEGVHLLQVGGVVVRVEVEKGSSATLMIPSLVPGDALTWAADPALGPDLARLLSVTVGTGKQFFVVSDKGVYQGAGETWRNITPVAKEVDYGLYMAGAGGALFVGGIVLAGTGMAAGNGAVDDASASSARYADWLDAQERYQSAKTRVIIGDLLAVAGAGLAAGGVAMQFMDSEVRFHPVLLAEGGGGVGVDVNLGTGR